MINALLKKLRNIHFCGIGGSGMSGIAEILIRLGFRITGSDLQTNEATKRLLRLGAVIHKGHDPKWVAGSQIVVYSSAVPVDHIELTEARLLKIPVIRRADMLAELVRMQTSILISGTHGKTGTSSMTGDVLTVGGLEPTLIVGGKVKRIGGGAVAGGGQFIVAEADEFDRSFLRLIPTIAVITNIDYDHIECYGSFEELENAFIQFANSVPSFFGRTIICLDDESLVRIMPRITSMVTTYGFSPQADVRAVDVKYEGEKSLFSVETGSGSLGQIKLPLPGRYNVQNALAAITVGLELDVKFPDIQKALEGFKGVHRRFEIYGEYNDILIIDDFAHHPRELSATISAAKSGWGRRITAVFQPHLFSRTRALAQEFGQALLEADTAVILPIYPAREDPIPGVTSKLIYDATLNFGHKNAIHLDDRSQAPEIIGDLVKPGDMLLILGAGDVYRIIPQIIKKLSDER